jgi:hypothetical protein
MAFVEGLSDFDRHFDPVVILSLTEKQKSRQKFGIYKSKA